MALLGFAIPLLGIGTLPSVIVVFLYSLLPIVKNTYIGISQISPGTIEAARGIGLTRQQILWKVQLPLTLPMLMAGRTNFSRYGRRPYDNCRLYRRRWFGLFSF